MFPQLCQHSCLYHISSTLDDSRLRYGGITIFKMLTSAILDFRNSPDLLRMRVILPPHSKFHLNGAYQHAAEL